MLGDRVIPGVTLLGGKTGFTDLAGQCLASLAECGGEEYICHIVDNIADSTAFGPALADVQRHDACGCHEFSLPSKKVGSLSCPLHQNMK